MSSSIESSSGAATVISAGSIPKGFFSLSLMIENCCCRNLSLPDNRDEALAYDVYAIPCFLIYLEAVDTLGGPRPY